MTKDDDIFLRNGGKTAGELLKAARESRGLSVEGVQDALKIQAKHINAIEFDDHDELPGRVYAVGFIKAYSEYMGFDPEEMVSLFKATGIGRHSSVSLSSHGEVVTVSQAPSTILVVICIVFLCGIGTFVGSANQSYGVAESVPEVSEDLVKGLEQKVTIAYDDGAFVEPQVTSEASVSLVKTIEKVASTSKEVKIKAIYDSWIDVKDDEGKSVYSGILQMGTSYDVPEGNGYTLMTGNAGGTEVFVSGKSAGTLGNVSQVRKGIKLDDMR